MRSRPAPRRPAYRRVRRSASRGAAASLAVALLVAGVLLAAWRAGWLAPPVPAPTPTPTPPPTPTAAPTPTPTPTAGPTATPTPEASPTPGGPTPTPDMAGLDAIPNTVLSWYYYPPSPTFADKPAGAPPKRVAVVEPYRAIWRAAPTGTKTVYLTFDEGYEYKGNTYRILATLAEKHVTAAFFVTGTYARDNPGLVKAMADAGHLVCSHTYTHPSLPEFVEKNGFAGVEREVEDTAAAVLAACGKPIAPYLRPPQGHYSARTLAMLEALGYRTVFWSFAYGDWDTTAQPSPAYGYDRVVGEAFDGEVILLHAVSTTDTDNLPAILQALLDRGYAFGSLADIP